MRGLDGDGERWCAAEATHRVRGFRNPTGISGARSDRRNHGALVPCSNAPMLLCSTAAWRCRNNGDMDQGCRTPAPHRHVGPVACVMLRRASSRCGSKVIGMLCHHPPKRLGGGHRGRGKSTAASHQIWGAPDRSIIDQIQQAGLVKKGNIDHEFRWFARQQITFRIAIP